MPRPPSHDLAVWIPRLLAVWRQGGAASRRPELASSPSKGSRAGHGRLDRRGPARHDRRPIGRAPEDALLPDELRTVAAAVQRLSHGLTRDRELAGARYMEEEKLLGAYLLFYWPVSYLQARGVVSELPRPPRTVLDLGSGPGPLAFAALDAGAREVTAADRSPRALAAARALAQAAGEALATRDWNPTRPDSLSGLADGRRFDLVTLGHVLNELWRGQDEDRRRADLVEQVLDLLAPGGSLVIIEPALRETSRALLRVRDLLVARGVAVRAPCLFRDACPALARESDWCHAERPVEPPALVAQIAKAAGLRREAVKMSYLVLAPKGEGWAPPPPGRVFRIVSEPLPSKGRLRYMACGPEGRMGLSLQEKHVSDGNRRFEGLLRGDVIEVTGGEPRGDGVALSEASTVRVIAEAGKPVPVDNHFP